MSLGGSPAPFPLPDRGTGKEDGPPEPVSGTDEPAEPRAPDPDVAGDGAWDERRAHRAALAAELALRDPDAATEEWRPASAGDETVILPAIEVDEPVIDDTVAMSPLAGDGEPQTSATPPVEPTTVSVPPVDPVDERPPPPWPPAPAAGAGIPRKPPRQQGGLRTVAIIAGAALIGIAVSAVLVDTAATAATTTHRLRLAARDVGGMSEPQLRDTVGRLGEELSTRSVTLRTAAGERSIAAAALGLGLDREAVVEAARSIDHEGPALLRPLLVVRSWFVSQDVPLSFSVDRDRVTAETAMDGLTPPAEPGIELRGDTFVLAPGASGEQVDSAVLAERVADAATEAPDGPWAVDVPTHEVKPRFTDEEAQRLADRANTIVKAPLTVNAGGRRATVPAPKVRGWIKAAPVGDRLELQADVDAVLRDVTEVIGKVGTEPTEASFKVNGDKVEVTPGKPGTKCCAPDTGTRVAEALLAGRSNVTLDLVEAPAKLGDAAVEKLGIAEKVSSFTTRHPAGQPRVTNIHKAADAVRGTVIEPGASFSLNQKLGQRTEAKGYVVDKGINRGVYEETVGGGISQLATTLFNAAFFAGLEFRTYQSHTIYIDRYPYGREATISWPAPDLSFRNQTPYGLLLWTSYDDTSITVSVYSTKWVNAEQTGQTKEQSGAACTKVRTERTRTWVKDGRRDVDYVTAIYQPEAGVLCDGSRVEVPPPGQQGQPGQEGQPGGAPPSPPGAQSPQPGAG